MVNFQFYLQYFKNQSLSHQIALISSIILMVGLSTSPAFMSIGSAGFALAFLVDLKNFKNNIYQFKKPIFWALFLLYFLHFIHFFSETNQNQLWTESRIKLPFILIPLGFLTYKPQKQDFTIISFFFIASITIASFLTLVNYFLHFEEMNQRILESKEIPVFTKVTHIYFSVMLAFAILLSFYLYQILHSKIYLFTSLFLFACIHIFTSRTGLVAFYFAGLVSFAYYTIKNKKILVGISGILLLIFLPLIAYFILPSFKNRVLNTYDDIQRYQKKEDINHRSVSMRLVAWEMSYYALLKNPILGVGMENINEKIKQEYSNHQVNLKEENWLHDLHNQFLEYLLGLGLLGFSIFLFWYFYPIFVQPNYLLIQFLAVLFGAMFAESMLERQVGVCFGIFWYYFLVIGNFYE